MRLTLFQTFHVCLLLLRGKGNGERNDDASQGIRECNYNKKQLASTAQVGAFAARAAWEASRTGART